MTSKLSIIWENTDGCAEQYRWASSLYLMSVFSQSHSIIIDQGISEPVNGKQLIDSINNIGKRYMYQLISNVQLIGSRTFYSQIIMHSCTPKNDFSLAKESQNHMSKDYCKHEVIDQGKYRKIFSEIKWTDRQYHVQYNSDIAHKDVKMYCDTDQLPT